ncbi:MAG TPA: TIGR03621 family F420-dependent LLM class oxidoreductase [Pseudonocardiaceae bacterium]|nr:TIGR03621 family F420-dependent LLM class oxidoreductase [Pseudonocardiaceae bacterium]
MSDRKFRFGLVAGNADTMDAWAATARRAEDAGFDVLLSPDTPNVCAPFVSLAAAAAVTTRLRLGTFVMAVPMRSPGLVAWETASLDRLSGGRFELGIGAGRPDAEGEAALLGAAWRSPKGRVEQVAETIGEVRRLHAEALAQPDRRAAGYLRPEQRPGPRVLVAGAGRSLLSVAARHADMVAFGLAGDAGEAALAEKVALVRSEAGDRFDDLELSLNIWAAGDSTLPPWLSSSFGLSLDTAVDNQVLAVLNGSPTEIADVLVRRRDQFGVSYITVNSLALDGFAPVIELLAGR